MKSRSEYILREVSPVREITKEMKISRQSDSIALAGD